MPRQLSEDEFKAISDQIEADLKQRLPRGLPETEYNRVFNPLFAAAVGKAENTAATPEGSALGRFVSGAVDVLNPITALSGLGQAMMHPLDTASNIYEAQKQQFQKAAAAPTLSEKVGYTAAGAVPLIGPAAARAGETIASGDIAGGLGQTAGLVAPAAASEALSVRGAPNPRAAAMLERQAEEQVAGRVLAPGAPAYRGRAAAIAPEVLARKLTGGRAELQQAAEEGMADAGQRLDDAIQTAGGTQAPVQVQPVVDALKDRIKSLQDAKGQPLSGQAATRINALTDRIRQLQGLGGRAGTASFEDLRKIRDESYRLADEARGYQRMGNPAMSDEGWAARETGSAIRETFAQRSPEAAQANADFSFFKTLNDVLDPVIGRPKTTAAPVGVTGGSRVTGALLGHMTGIPGAGFVMGVMVPWVRDMMASPKWQLASAQQKMKLAEAMRNGDIGAMKTLMAKWGPAGTEAGNLIALPPGVPSLSGVQGQPPTPEQSAGR